MNKILTINKAAFRIATGVLRWHISRYLLRRDYPLLATFQLTNRCNFNCIMCNIKNNPRQDTLPLEDFKRIIDELAGMGTVYATLSGGEPLLIKNIIDYVSYSKDRIPFVNLVTNGYLLSEETAAAIGRSGLDSLSISIDALEKKNDALRGVSGAFGRAVSAIGMLKKQAPKTAITVNTVISAWNLDEIIGLTEFVESLGVRQKFQPLYEHPEFSGQSAVYNTASWPGPRIDKVKEIISVLLKKKHVANSAYYLSCLPDYFSGSFDKDIFQRDCIYPAFSIEFTQDGMIYPCIVGKGWQGGYDARQGVSNAIRSQYYRNEVEKLKACRLCRKNFSVCYAETRLALPFTSFLRYNLNFAK